MFVVTCIRTENLWRGIISNIARGSRLRFIVIFHTLAQAVNTLVTPADTSLVSSQGY